MPDLNFEVLGIAAAPSSAAPQLVAKLRVANATPTTPVRNIALRCQVQIETNRRRYAPAEQEHLFDLYGEPERWSRTLGRLLWTETTASVGPFDAETIVDLPIPCTFDFNVAATKYFHGLEQGEVPLTFMFTGTIFFANAAGGLHIAQIPWDKEASFRLPVGVWREMMDAYYPNSVWLRLRRDVFDRLQVFKSSRGLPTWEETLEALLGETGQRSAIRALDEVRI